MRGCVLPRSTDSSNPADWLYIAENDLEGVCALAESQLAYEMCRSKLAEIIEKVLKAELLRSGWFLEKTHDLHRLASFFQERQSDLVGTIRPLVTAYAEVYFTARYPGFDLEDPDWPQLTADVQTVQTLLFTVKGRLE